MLKEVYLALQRLLYESGSTSFNYVLPVVFTSQPGGDLVKHFDWFNRSERAPQGQDRSMPYLTPAALVEFLPLSWVGLTNRVLQSPLEFNLYIVQERVLEKQADNPLQSEALAHLDLIDEIMERLTGSMATIQVGGEDQVLFNGLRLLSVTPDHNADSRYVTVMRFQTTVFEYKTQVKYKLHLIPDNEVNGQVCPLPLNEE